MASLATDMEQLSVQENEEMHLQKFKALNLKVKDSIKLHWDNTTADVSKQKVYDAKFTKLYTPTKTLGYRVGVSYANRGGKETIIIGDFIKRLANTEEVAKNNALRSNNELAKKKKIEEKKAKKASKAEAEKAELKSLKDAKNKGKATIEMFQYDDCEDDVWFVDKLPLIQAYCMEILHNEIFQDEDLKIAWQFTEQYYWNDFSTGDCFYFGFLNNTTTKKTLLESIAKAGKMYGEVWDGDIYGYGTTKTTYDIYLGEQINVENPICKVSGEPIEDNDIVVVVSRLPPIMDQDEKGNCHLIDFKKYPHMFKKNDSNWHGAGDQGDWVDCAISCNWKFQTFVKLKHLTTRSKTALLKRSAPIGYTNSNGGWSFISYNNQGDDDYPEDYCKTLGEKVKQLSEEKEDSDSDSSEDSSDLEAAPLRASPRRFGVSNDAPSRRKAPEPRKNRAEVVAKKHWFDPDVYEGIFALLEGTEKIKYYEGIFPLLELLEKSKLLQSESSDKYYEDKSFYLDSINSKKLFYYVREAANKEVRGGNDKKTDVWEGGVFCFANIRHYIENAIPCIHNYGSFETVEEYEKQKAEFDEKKFYEKTNPMPLYEDAFKEFDTSKEPSTPRGRLKYNRVNEYYVCSICGKDILVKDAMITIIPMDYFKRNIRYDRGFSCILDVDDTYPIVSEAEWKRRKGEDYIYYQRDFYDYTNIPRYHERCIDVTGLRSSKEFYEAYKHFYKLYQPTFSGFWSNVHLDDYDDKCYNFLEKKIKKKFTHKKDFDKNKEMLFQNVELKFSLCEYVESVIQDNIQNYPEYVIYDAKHMSPYSRTLKQDCPLEIAYWKDDEKIVVKKPLDLPLGMDIHGDCGIECCHWVENQAIENYCKDEKHFLYRFKDDEQKRWHIAYFDDK